MTQPASDARHDAAVTAVEQCLAVGRRETVVVVTDDPCREVGLALYHAAAARSEEAVFVEIPPGEEHGAEPPAPAAAALRAADAFLAPTSKSISHTRARREACSAGARGATLPGITEDVFVTGLAADYDEIEATCDRTYEAVRDAETIRVTSPAGTDITFSIGDRDWHRDTGIVHEAGDFSNLPAGEVFVSPETADGVYVVDGTIHPHGLLGPDQSVTITVEDGYATDIDDQEVAAQFARAAESVGRDAYNLAEFGIGTNLAVTTLVGSVLLDEKAAGTVHVALGDNASIGGSTDAPIHSDGIILEPTVHVDGDSLALPGQ